LEPISVDASTNGFSSQMWPCTVHEWFRWWPAGCTTRNHTGVPASAVNSGVTGSWPPTWSLDSTFVKSSFRVFVSGSSGSNPIRFHNGSVV
jgi:hypothetical protein